MVVEGLGEGVSMRKRGCLGCGGNVNVGVPQCRCFGVLLLCLV